MLVVVCGLQGVGKTVVAKYIADKTGSCLLRTDVIRKELIRILRYTEEEMQRIYAEMFLRAEKQLSLTGVVLDATFYRQDNRMQARKIADKTGNEFILVEVVCYNNEVVRQRMRDRTGDASEAQFEQYLKMKTLFQPISEQHIIIDNSGSEEETRRQVDMYFS